MEPAATRQLRNFAYFVVVIAGLKAAASLVLPMLFAAVVAMACIPFTKRLSQWGMPHVPAVFAVVGGVMLSMMVVSKIVADSVPRLTEQVKSNMHQFDPLAEKVEAVLAFFQFEPVVEGEGAEVPALAALADGSADGPADGPVNELVDEVSDRPPADGSEAPAAAGGRDVDVASLLKKNTGALVGLVSATANGVLGFVSNLAVILLIVIFILLEVHGFPGKLRRALGDDFADISSWAKVTDQVYGYLAIKAVMSLITGAGAAVLTWAVGVQSPMLWGLIAFLFNFIPNVGSVIAAVPAVLMAFIGGGVTDAAIVGAGYIAINMIVGNVLEPKVMGERLGLSPMVVILSLVFWSWVWGPVGMLLSLPVTMAVKIALENTEEFRFIGVLLGPAQVARRAGGRRG